MHYFAVLGFEYFRCITLGIIIEMTVKIIIYERGFQMIYIYFFFINRISSFYIPPTKRKPVLRAAIGAQRANSHFEQTDEVIRRVRLAP